MGPMVAVRRFEDGDAAAVAAIVEGLPDYFTSDVPEKAPRDAERHDAWVLTSADAGSHADAVTGSRRAAFERPGDRLPTPGRPIRRTGPQAGAPPTQTRPFRR